jgi:hypothetical protein
MKITLTNEATPQVQTILAGLRDKTRMNRLVGDRVRGYTRDHLIARSMSQRNRLGAPTSGFWRQAAEAVGRGPLAADNEGVSVSLNHPGIARAFGDVTIRPRSGLYLTIPLIVEAYNKRAYRQRGLFVWKSKKSGKLFLAEGIKARGVKGKLRLWYLLVPSVMQKQDSTILPTEQEITSVALGGVRSYIELLLAAKQQQRGNQPSQGGAQ